MSSSDKNKIVIKRKRPRSEDSSDDNSPSSKKRKITIQDPSKQETIEAIIDESELIHQLNIPIIIHKEIASYAEGKVKYCSNKQCNQVICVFNEDGTNTRYKCCVSGSQTFCTECMEFAIPAIEMATHTSDTSCGCDESGANKLHCYAEDIKGCYARCCHRLQFVPDCPKCDFCHEPIPLQCDCHHMYSKCDNCGSKSCSNCDIDSVCISCNKTICCTCKQDTDVDCVCIKCYDDTVVKCTQCDASYPLLSAGNECLHNESTGMLTVLLFSCPSVSIWHPLDDHLHNCHDTTKLLSDFYH
eukprot:360586_1